MKDSINVLFVCGYGVGSSAMSAGIVSKALTNKSVRNVVDHTSAGETAGRADWADIIAVSKQFIGIVNSEIYPDKHVIEVKNIMDGHTISDQIIEIVKVEYPGAMMDKE